MSKLKIDVDGVDKTIRRIKRDLHRGMEKSVDTLIDNAKDHARRTIHEERAIFNAEVYSGFKTAETKNTPTTVRKKLYNDVDHAGALEHGAEYPSRGPPIEALLPWVARKMNGNWSLDDSFGGGGDGMSNDRDDGGSSPPDAIDEQNPDEDDEENWGFVPTDYDSAKLLSEGDVVKSKYTDAPIRRIDSTDGIVLGWNKEKFKLEPSGSSFYAHQKMSDGEWDFVEQIPEAQVYEIIKEKDQTIIGYKPGTYDGFSSDFYRTSNIPDGYEYNYSESIWDDISEWQENIGISVIYRNDDGLIKQGKVSDVTDDTVKVSGDFSYNYYPGNSDDSEIKIIAIEDDDRDLSALERMALEGEVDVDIDDIFGTSDFYLRDREGVFKNYKSVFEKDAITLFNKIEEWKSGGSKKLRSTSMYSHVLKKSLNIDADVRGEDQIGNISQDQLTMAKSLNELSKTFLKRHYDDDNDGRVRMFRTLRNESPLLSREIWENPSQDQWEIPTNAVNNYTTTRSNLEGFDRSLLHRKDFDVDDDVLIAIDALIHSDWDREGEVHIRGDYNTVFEATDLDFESRAYSDSVDYLTDQFFEKGSFTSFQDPQMLAIASTVREMGKNNTALRTDDGKDRLSNFIEEFLDRGLASDTDYDAEQWRDWKDLINGNGEVLEFDGRTRAYSSNWNTYDPTKVDTIPIDETYDGQQVEIIDVNTDQIIEGTIVSRSALSRHYTVETDQGKTHDIFKPGVAGFDDYKIIATKKWDTLDDDAKDQLISDKAGELSFSGFDSANFEITLQSYFDVIKRSYKDKRSYYNVLHKAKVDKNTKKDVWGSHDLSSSGKHEFTMATDANKATVIHEAAHADHDAHGYSGNKYPNGDVNKLYKNLFNEDGTNQTSESWLLEDVLLSDEFDEVPGLPDDGSFPEVIKDRVENTATYVYEDLDQSSMNVFLDPVYGDFEVGDRIKFETPTMDTKGELKNVKSFDPGETDFDFVGDEITVYEINPIDASSSKTVDIWVDDDGRLVEMKGVTISAKADQPEEATDKSIPDVDIENEGYEGLVEATNMAYMEIVYSGTTIHNDNKDLRADNIPFIGRPYTSRAANEVLTTTTELLTMNVDNPSRSYLSENKLDFLIETYPHLVEEWLKVRNPSPEVADVLKDNGYNL